MFSPCIPYSRESDKQTYTQVNTYINLIFLQNMDVFNKVTKDVIMIDGYHLMPLCVVCFNLSLYLVIGP